MMFLFFYVFLITLLCVVLIAYWKFVRPQKRLYDAFRSQGVPGEPYVPICGQILQLNHASANDTFIDYFSHCAQKHGFTYLLCFGPLVQLIVSDPDMIADVLGRTHADDYAKTTMNKAVFGPVIGFHNLIVSNGVEHDRARKMINPAFHFINLKGMVPTMANQTKRTINEFFVSIDESKINLQTELSKLSLAIIASCAFGKGFESNESDKNVIRRTFSVVLEAVIYRTMYMINQIPLLDKLPFWKKDILDKGKRELSQFIEQIINDRRNDRSKSLSAGPDLLDILLSVTDAEGKAFIDQEIKDESLTFVFAGHETTAHLLTWTMYALMTNEKVLQACIDEVDRVLTDVIEVTYEILNELVICEAVLQETLRLYPPAPYFGRQCIREHTIGSKGSRQLRIPANAIVMVNTYLLHRREEFWPRPLEFNYTRWLRDPVTGLKPKLVHPYCYLPFGAGLRSCIGQNFALLEAKVVVAMLLKRCIFELEPGQKVVPDVQITMRPRYGLWTRVCKR